MQFGFDGDDHKKLPPFSSSDYALCCPHATLSPVLLRPRPLTDLMRSFLLLSCPQATPSAVLSSGHTPCYYPKATTLLLPPSGLVLCSPAPLRLRPLLFLSLSGHAHCYAISLRPRPLLFRPSQDTPTAVPSLSGHAHCCSVPLRARPKATPREMRRELNEREVVVVVVVCVCDRGCGCGD